MLTLVASLKEKNDAHAKLQARLEKAWSNYEMRVVTWRPDSRRITIHHNGHYWFASFPPNENDLTRRNWNPFGEYRENGNLQIAVELNVPTDSNSKRVSGFFARDAKSGSVYLMHDGGVRGGQTGVSRRAFLAWSDSELMPVIDGKGDIRPGIVVAPVDARTTATDIARFVQKAIDFKEAVRNGETATPQARSAQRRYDDYFDEFSGKKRRRRVEELEYISRHGDIVKALREWRLRTIKTHERLFNNTYVDLGIRTRGVTREIYEVKTGCDRQSLYAAIGQVVVHDDSPNGDCSRFLVLPKGDPIPDDVTRALARADIALVRFTLQGEKVRIFAT